MKIKIKQVATNIASQFKFSPQVTGVTELQNLFVICFLVHKCVYICVCEYMSTMWVCVCVHMHACTGLFVYKSACVCIMRVLCSAICVQVILGPWCVLRGEKERDRREAQAAGSGINRHYPAVF